MTVGAKLYKYCFNRYKTDDILLMIDTHVGNLKLCLGVYDCPSTIW